MALYFLGLPDSSIHCPRNLFGDVEHYEYTLCIIQSHDK